MLAGRTEPAGPGEMVESVALVRNLSADTDTFDVLVHGDAAPWVEIEPAVLTLAPGEERSVWLRFRLPVDLGATGYAAPVAYAVTVSSHNEPEFIHAERGEINVSPFVSPPFRPPDPIPEGRHVELVETADTVEIEEIDEDEENERSLARALSRSAIVFGALLLLAYIVIATVDTDEPPATSVAPPATSLTAPDATDVVGQPAGGTGGQQASDPFPESEQPAQSVADAPADLPLLAFVRWYGPGDRDIVVRDPGTSGRELRLRSPGSVESSPSLSPDGATIAYVRERGGRWQVCTIPRIGGEPACLLDVGSGSSVAWRPDGAALYVSVGVDLVMIEVGSDRRTAGAATTMPVKVAGGDFSLSSAGDQVAFVEGSKIVIRPLSGGEGRVVAVPATPEAPAFSTDGTHILYTADTQIYLAPLGGGAIRRLTKPATVNGEAVVAGRWAVFRSNRSGNGDLYAVRLDVSDPEDGIAIVTTAGERDAEPTS